MVLKRIFMEYIAHFLTFQYNGIQDINSIEIKMFY